MIFFVDILMRIAVAFLALCGFLICKHIHTQKKSSNPFLCPLKFNCHAVVHSNYSHFFGISLEIYGMFYYAFVFLSYLLMAFIFTNLSFPFSAFFAGLSFLAFLFSIYLTLIQLFVLKEGCFWCFVSAFLSVLIFILSFFLYDMGFILLRIF